MKTETPCEPLLTDLLLYPTSRCNLKCRHCYFVPVYDTVAGRGPNEISYEQIRGIIDQLLPFGLKACKLSGGEPFLREDLIAICNHLDSKGIRVVIETNGTLVTKQHAEALARLRGNTFVSVSIDGATEQTHEALRGVTGCFRRALEGFEHLVRAGLYVQVITAAYEDNKNELARIVDLCATKGAASFKVCFVHAAGRGKDLPLIDREEAAAIDTRIAERVKAAGMRYCSSIPPALQSVTQIITSCTFSSRCNITSSLGILADGTITVCGMGRHATDFRFGKLGGDDVAEVWRNHATLKLIRGGIPGRLQGICGRCIVRSACRGYCRLENEDVTLSSFFDPFPRCAEMEKLNRFPQSRIVDRSPAPAVAVAREKGRPEAPYPSAT